MHEGVILVMDELEVFEAAAAVLRRELHNDHLIHEASLSGALARLDAHMPLDLVIADWDLGGASLLRTLRADPETHHTPFIVTSRNDADAVIAAAMRLGATDHMAKPFLEKGLVSTLRRITKNQERRRLRRVRPPLPVQVTVRIGSDELQLPLMDLSITGCQMRASLEVADRFRVYQRGSLRLELDPPLLLEGELIRLTHDQEARGQSILVAFQLLLPDDGRERLGALLDDWREAAQAVEPAEA